MIIALKEVALMLLDNKTGYIIGFPETKTKAKNKQELIKELTLKWKNIQKNVS